MEQPCFPARHSMLFSTWRKVAATTTKTQSRNSPFQWMQQKTRLFSARLQKISRRCSFWDGLWPEVSRLICWAVMWETPQIVLSTFTGRSEVRLDCWTSAWSREGFSDSPQDTAGGRTPAATGALTQTIQFYGTSLKSRCIKPSCSRVSHTAGLQTQGWNQLSFFVFKMLSWFPRNQNTTLRCLTNSPKPPLISYKATKGKEIVSVEKLELSNVCIFV